MNKFLKTSAVLIVGVFANTTLTLTNGSDVERSYYEREISSLEKQMIEITSKSSNLLAQQLKAYNELQQLGFSDSPEAILLKQEIQTDAIEGQVYADQAQDLARRIGKLIEESESLRSRNDTTGSGCQNPTSFVSQLIETKMAPTATLLPNGDRQYTTARTQAKEDAYAAAEKKKEEAAEEMRKAHEGHQRIQVVLAKIETAAGEVRSATDEDDCYDIDNAEEKVRFHVGIFDAAKYERENGISQQRTTTPKLSYKGKLRKKTDPIVRKEALKRR